jgi:CBS domain-containing protein
MNVNEAMTTPVKTCNASTSLDEIAKMMWEGNCGAIPVVSESCQPVGIVTDRDIAMAAMLNHQPLWNIPASMVIQGQDISCCSQQEPIENCVGKMEEKGVRRILVTDDSGALCGIVSMGDAVAFTQPDKAGSQRSTIGAEQVLGMLRKVSAHHESGNHSLTKI